MTTIVPPASEFDRYTGIADALAGPGWCVTPFFVSSGEVLSIRAEAAVLRAQGAFKPAGIGRGEDLLVRSEIRSDRVYWLDPAAREGAIGAYMARLEDLRQTLNRDLMLGLFSFEGHLASYPPGSFYRRHLDQFRGVELRTLTAILYLNPDWQPADGGTLRVYTDPDRPDHYETVAPIGGTLVTFLSARFEHEVMPAIRERLSLTGWFKRRG
ncbi:2OG-Fe(II) oxygenase [uncultured Thiodictyon sp.]|uniref:2OG-Fe(II) oxygenase n=1 Tax=uncultured Thiodictyon sp. TaxID=1846217 RepID=UPI0025DA124B|nr:2OG-Fe(II) oxygenase [uncultured Thiodictyon sp.]